MKKHYKTLGVDKTASATDIKRAYRKKAKELHPDQGGDQNRFAEVAIAYRVLIDPGKREQYDRGEATDDTISAETKIEQDANNLILSMLETLVDTLLERPKQADIIALAKRELEALQTQHQKVIGDGERILKRISSARPSVVYRGDRVNLMKQILDRREDVARESIMNAKYRLEVTARATEVIGDYKWDGEIMMGRMYGNVMGFNNSTSASFNWDMP